MKFNDEEFYKWLEKERSIDGLFDDLKTEFGMERLVGRIPPCRERTRIDLYEVAHKAAAFLPEPLKWEIPYIADMFFDVAGRIFPSFDTMTAYHIYAESLLYYELDYPKYKEHFVHSFKTAYVADAILETRGLDLKKTIAQILLNNCKSNQSGLKSFCEHHNIRPDEIIDENFVRTTMLFTCLFHDIGYLHFVFCQAEEKMRRAYPFYTGDAAASSIAGLNRDTFCLSLLNDFFKDESDRNSGNGDSYIKFPNYIKTEIETVLYRNLNANHSMSGALAILSYLDRLREAATGEMLPEHTLIFNLAAEAVFTHDLVLIDNDTNELLYNGPKIKLKFSERPLGVLLLIADHIQCWGRPKITRTKSSVNTLEITFEADVESKNIKIDTLAGLRKVLSGIKKDIPKGNSYFTIAPSMT